jgi:hypothetical protein
MRRTLKAPFDVVKVAVFGIGALLSDGNVRVYETASALDDDRCPEHQERLEPFER